MSPVRQPEATRLKILETALDLFHRGTFNATSVNEIVEKSGITKGALFHHFKGKMELGYAVVDELLVNELRSVWGKALGNSEDPVSDLRALLQGFAVEFRESPELMVWGCPINNLTQEMSSVNENFRLKLMALYDEWVEILESSLRSGIECGTVRSDADPHASALTIIALFEGTVGLIKVHQSLEFMDRIAGGLAAYLEGLRP